MNLGRGLQRNLRIITRGYACTGQRNEVRLPPVWECTRVCHWLLPPKTFGGGGAYSQRIEMEAKWVPNIIALSASNSPKPYGSALSHYKLTLMHLPILDMLMQKTGGRRCAWCPFWIDSCRMHLSVCVRFVSMLAHGRMCRETRLAAKIINIDASWSNVGPFLPSGA